MEDYIEKIERIERILKSWSADKAVNPIEREVVLRLLGEIYEWVYFTAPAAEQIENQTIAEPEPVAEPEPALEPQPEQEQEQEQEQGQEQEQEQEPIVMPKHKIDRKTILSIYNDSFEPVAPYKKEPEPEPEPEQVPEPVVVEVEESVFEAEAPEVENNEAENEEVVEEDIEISVEELEPIEVAVPATKEVETEAPEPEIDETQIPDEQPVVSKEPLDEADIAAPFTVVAAHEEPITVAEAVSSLRESIGLNDKFLLLGDLFSNDNALFEQVIEALDGFDSLDDALLYIHDNYRWNPNSEGARLIVDLLARKLS